MRIRGHAARTWRDSCVSAEEAVARVPAGAHVFVGTATGTPRTLLAALESRAVEHPGVQLVHFLADPGEPSSILRQRVFYIGTNVAGLMSSGRVDYVPLPLQEAPRLMRLGRLQVDVAFVQVSPPDMAGRCSLGVSVDATLEAVRQARLVIAEINPAMPWTGPHSLVPFDRFDAIVEVEPMVAEYVHPPGGAATEQIARYVARLVDDGATLQTGLGRVPNQVLRYLGSRRDLGIHSDIITDSLVELMSTGAVTGRLKTMSKGRVVASLALGTRQLYDLIDENPDVDFRPIDEVADTDVVASQRRMVSITQAFSVDLTGQVCAEGRGGELYGGVSAQAGFHRGAVRCREGRAIVCLLSTAPDGSSAIRPFLDSTEPVTLPRWEVHWVVTEYGTAFLQGASLRERAIGLIEIAHPDHREALLAAAADLQLLPPNQRLRSRLAYPVDEEREVELRRGEQVLVRPTRTSDAPGLQALFYRLRPEDVVTRFFRRLSSLTLAHAEHLASVGYEKEMTFAAVVGGPERGRVVGTASYFVDPETGLADVAYMVDPEWQGRGLGKALHEITVDYARRHGVRGFTADVLSGNDAMMAIFRSSIGDLEVIEDDGRYEISLTWPVSSR
ncbi:MAG TPA: GNAT family N-acetyltransferase [Jiangellaceae bacterium]|nr:GNAT family N-acetyltransferase [Jiangellaceae bacterium]